MSLESQINKLKAEAAELRVQNENFKNQIEQLSQKIEQLEQIVAEQNTDDTYQTNSNGKRRRTSNEDYGDTHAKETNPNTTISNPTINDDNFFDGDIDLNQDFEIEEQPGVASSSTAVPPLTQIKKEEPSNHSTSNGTVIQEQNRKNQAQHPLFTLIPNSDSSIVDHQSKHQQQELHSQTICCVLHCDKPVINNNKIRKINCIRNKDVEFKQEFLDRGWIRICERCYRQDLRLSKHTSTDSSSSNHNQPTSPPPTLTNPQPASSLPSPYTVNTFVRYHHHGDTNYIGQISEIVDTNQRIIVRYIIPTELSENQRDFLDTPEEGELLETTEQHLVNVHQITEIITLRSYDEVIDLKYGQGKTDEDLFYLSENHFGLIFNVAENRVVFRE